MSDYTLVEMSACWQYEQNGWKKDGDAVHPHQWQSLLF
jgi:hypothetical protein